MEKDAKKEITVEIKIATTVTRYIIACIMRKQRVEDLEGGTTAFYPRSADLI
jgi:hypothetical protein